MTLQNFKWVWLNSSFYLTLNSSLQSACAALSHSAVSDSVTPWTATHQAPLSIGILLSRILDWVAVPSSRGSSQPKDRTPHCRQILYHMSHQGSLRILEWVAYPFCRGTSWPRNWTGFPALQADSLPAELLGKPSFQSMNGQMFLHRKNSQVTQLKMNLFTFMVYPNK